MEKEIRDNIKISVREGAPENPTFPEADAWTVRLSYQGQQMQVPFYKGLGHQGAEPNVDELMEALLSDASTMENSRTFEEWCDELGFDSDSRKHERMYRQTQRQTASLKRMLGDDYERALWGQDDES